ncbi:MAG: hypothetical protein AB7R55_14735 [Gemmatimonadales bacterium]
MSEVEWIVLGWAELGRVRATDRSTAVWMAKQAFGSGRVERVQSRASAEVAAEERAALDRDWRLGLRKREG